MSKGEIHVTSDLKSYFQHEVVQTAEKQGLGVSPNVVHYLGAVLSKFVDARNYLTQSDINEGKNSYPTLALLWMEGLAKPLSEQLFAMQHLGDVALFTTGFFGERINKSVVDMDYYMAVGGRAYETAGKIRETLAAERQLNVYFELAANFREFSELFAELSDKTQLTSDQGLLRLYEKWLSGRSPRLHRMLAESGVISAPPANSRTDKE